MAAGKHRQDGQPRTGDGKTSGRKPARLEMSQKTKSGTTIWSATAKLFGSSKKKAK